MMKHEFLNEQGGLNLREAADFIGTNHTTMCALVRTPGFPAFRLGRRWVIPKDALLAWMNDLATQRATVDPDAGQVIGQ